MADSGKLDKTAVRNTLEKLNELNEKYLQTANSEDDVHFYNAIQSMLHATALKLYGYTEDRDYKIEADLHLLLAQVEYLHLLEGESETAEKKNRIVVLAPQGPRIEYTDQHSTEV